MKSQKGFTLVAVTVYVIVIALVIGVIASVTSFFYSNNKYIDESGKDAAQFDTFNMFFLEDVKKEGNEIVGLKASDENAVMTKTIEFSDGTVYTIKDDGIYRNKVKICSNVNSNSGFKCENKNGQILVTANLTFGDTFAKNVEYLAQGKVKGAYSYEIIDPQEANSPDLATNMTPVIWNGNSWETTTEDNPDWYNYDKGINQWANAVIGTYNPGIDLGTGEDYSFYVWIPRFEYDPEVVSIKFVNGNAKSDMTHPAFSKTYNPNLTDATVESQQIELEGFWVSKFRANENYGFCNIAEAPINLNLAGYFEWFIDQLSNNQDTQDIIAPIINDSRIMHIQTNTDYGAILYLTLCVLDGKIPQFQNTAERIMDEEYSTTGNMTGVFETNIAEGQLVSALYSSVDYPCQDKEYYKDGTYDSHFYIARIADNTSNSISNLASDRFLGTGLNFIEGQEIIEDYGKIYLRDETGAQIVDIETNSTFHIVIMRTDAR